MHAFSPPPLPGAADCARLAAERPRLPPALPVLGSRCPDTRGGRAGLDARAGTFCSSPPFPLACTGAERPSSACLCLQPDLTALLLPTLAPGLVDRLACIWKEMPRALPSHHCNLLRSLRVAPPARGMLQRDRGVSVQSRCWADSGHCEHLKTHPQARRGGGREAH